MRPIHPQTSASEVAPEATAAPVEEKQGLVALEGLQFTSERSPRRLLERLDAACLAAEKVEIPERFFVVMRSAVEFSTRLANRMVCFPKCQELALFALERSLENISSALDGGAHSDALNELRESVQETLLFVRSRCASVVVAWMPELLSRVITEAEVAIIASECADAEAPDVVRDHRAKRESKMAERIFAAQNREGAFDRLLGRMKKLTKMLPEVSSLASLKLVSDAAIQASDVFTAPRTEEEGALVDTPDARFKRAFRLFLKILPNADRDELDIDDRIPAERVRVAAKVLELIRLEHEWELWNTPDGLHYTPEQIESFIRATKRRSPDRSEDARVATRDDDIGFPWAMGIEKLLEAAHVDQLIAANGLQSTLELSREKLQERARLQMPSAAPLRIFQYNPGCEIYAPETVIDDVRHLQEQWSLERRQTPNTPVIERPFSYEELVRRMRVNKEVYIVARIDQETLGAYLVFVNDDRLPWSGNEIKRIIGSSETVYADEVVKERRSSYPGIYRLLDRSMEAAARVHGLGKPVEIVGLVEPANEQIMKVHAKKGWYETGYSITSSEGLKFHIIRRPVPAVSDNEGA